MNRRGFFKTLFGTVAASVAVPLIPQLEAKAAVPDLRSLIPMIRRTMPTLIAADLIGVQPMTGPTGQTFHMNIGPIKKS